MIIKVVEKKNPLAVHAHCYSLESAQRWIDNADRELNAGRNIYMDKTIKAGDFTIKQD